jgi:hypothetical protein
MANPSDASSGKLSRWRITKSGPPRKRALYLASPRELSSRESTGQGNISSNKRNVPSWSPSAVQRTLCFLPEAGRLRPLSHIPRKFRPQKLRSNDESIEVHSRFRCTRCQRLKENPQRRRSRNGLARWRPRWKCSMRVSSTPTTAIAYFLQTFRQNDWNLSARPGRLRLVAAFLCVQIETRLNFRKRNPTGTRFRPAMSGALKL